MRDLVDVLNFQDGTKMALRPVASSDRDQLQRLVAELSPRDRRWRFHGAVNSLNDDRLIAMTTPGQGSMALVATVHDELIADVRCSIDRTGSAAEFAVMVAMRWRRRGVASVCLAALSRAAAQRGLHWLYGSVIADNLPMLKLMRQSGFLCSPSRYDDLLITVEKRIAHID
jgi:RimJ/RimL family protein N-acetyltransferase